MKKIYLLILMFFAFEISSIAQYVNIPDKNFKKYLINNTEINADADTNISFTEASTYTGGIFVESGNIRSLVGIEAFVNIDTLICGDNKITSLDLSNNLKLQTLTCENTSIKSLDISKNTELTVLNATGDSLTTLDITKNINLEILMVPGTKLSKLNVTNNPELYAILLDSTQIDTIDISSQFSLLYFYATKVPTLKVIYVKASQDTTQADWIKDATAQYRLKAIPQYVNIPDKNFKNYLINNSEINIDADTNISYIEASSYTGGIFVESENISSLFGIEAFVNIDTLNCGNNKITSLDLRSNLKLQILSCENTSIKTLDISKNAELTSLNVTGDSLTSLDLRNNLKLQILSCENTLIKSLDISKNTVLTSLNATGAGLTTLDLSKNINLEILMVSGTKLSKLNLTNNPELYKILVESTQIDTIDISSQASLLYFYATKVPTLKAIYVRATQDTTQADWIKDATAKYRLKATPQFVNIPDITFKNYLINNSKINTDADTNISYLEASQYSGKLLVNNSFINSFIGIEAFVNIDTLIILGGSNNNLKKINLSNNAKLGILIVDNIESLVKIDLSKNLSLVDLDIRRTSLSAIDLSNNTKLKRVHLYGNELTSIDLGTNDSLIYFESGDKGSSAPALTYLNINNCKSLKGLVLSHDITNFDIRNLTKLDTLAVSSGGKQSHISSLDLSNKPNLKYLQIVGNHIITVLDLSKNLNLEYLDCRANNLFSIDVSKNTLLKYFLASYNFQLTSIDVRNTKLPKDSNAVDFSNNPQLRTICIDNSQVSDTAFWKKDATAHYSTTCARLQQYVNIPDPRFKARLVGNTSINTDGDGEISFTEASAYTGPITVSNDSISSLVGIEAFVNIDTLDCRLNQLTSLDVSKNTLLTSLNCYKNQLTSLDVSKNIALTALDCDKNQLTSIDVSKNIALTALRCSNNQITSLDVAKNIALTVLTCFKNRLSSLDVTKNIALTGLYCDTNQLTSLDVTKNLALIYLFCENNQLQNIDISKNVNLWWFFCRNNQLMSIDVTKNLNLGWFYCTGNLLKSLNVTKNSNLISFEASNNQISYLNVAYNRKLNWLKVENNNLTSLYLVQNPQLVRLHTKYNPQLSSICASPTQNTSAWIKDSATVISTTCTRANDNILLADNYSLDKGEKDKFLNVLANDNAVSLQTLYIDLMPDSAGIQQELTTSAGTFVVKNQNQLYFSPSDTVGNVTVKYMLIDSAGIITSNTTTIDLAVKSKLKFYSGFSPNGDNVNNHFHITYVRPNSTVKLNVYDMNGFVVYTNDNYDNKWEGLDNDGKKLANGTYYYIVQYQDATANSEVVQYNGFVEIRY